MNVLLNRRSAWGASGLLALLCIAPVHGTPIAIVNGDFEADGADNVAPPLGWTDLSVSDAGGSPPSFWTGVVDEPSNPTAAEAALAPAPGLGNYFLTTARDSAGEPDQPIDGTLVQTVDLSAFGAAIDAGDQQLFVDFIWASDDHRDTGTFSLHFFGTTDGTGAELGPGYSVAMDDADDFNFVGWFEESVGGAVPASTRSVTLQIDSTRSGGSASNVWIDNITGEIGAAIPEPSSAILMGLSCMAFFPRRRQA